MCFKALLLPNIALSLQRLQKATKTPTEIQNRIV
ncbi:hypothetical protein glysoja_032310 [Glycine soja]|uniref:Uncharacterized protein n=1 Tax=Glycine soja TaxID=3848 RepID=A0A0B2PFD9_GLYSO|nr:hypothetical protein glysoja_032310 [Glycine soja]